jgi:hypothetical protein
MDGVSGVHPGGVTQSLRARLPEILIQTFFVLVAVLLALVVDEWREDRELDRLAAEARAAILSELTRNRDELASGEEQLEAVVANVQAVIDGGDEPAVGESLSVQLNLALLSTAAWQAAQSSEALRRLDYDWVIETAQLYELQDMYVRAQWGAVEDLVAIGPGGASGVSPKDIARQLIGRLQMLATLHAGLKGSYAEVLDAEAED